MTPYSPEVAAAIQEAFDAAVTHYKAGQFEVAEELYRAILQLDPQHPNANYNLGLLAVQLNRAQDAANFFKAALMAAPQEEKFWLSYLEVLVSAGDQEAAQQTLALSRKHGMTLHGHVIDRLQSPAPPVGLSAARAAQNPVVQKSSLQPTSAELNALQQAFLAKDFQTLERLGQAAVAAYPDATPGWKALSLAYFNTNRADLALTPTQRLVELAPEDAQAHANLGLMFMTLRRLPEAEACLLRAIALDPKVADTHTNLGTVRRDQNRYAEAELSYRRALVLEPNHAIAHANLGVVLSELGNYREAEGSLRTALALNPDDFAALGTLATTLVRLGRLAEAEPVLRRSLEVKPDFLGAYNLLLFVANYTHATQTVDTRELAVQFGKLLTQKAARRYTEWTCEPKPKRLKVGVVSGDLHSHPIGYFIEALLRHIDLKRVEVIAYSSMPPRKYDGLTERLRTLFSAWNDIRLLAPEKAAEQIHADGIHVLLDLSGHSSDNRLPVFAMKPAPAQASWLGYFATTGVAEMDYFIGDPWLCPPEEEKDFTEAVRRLPQTWLCFTPPEQDVEVAELPALKNGHVTFGCFNNLNKMNDAVVALWAELLRSVPTARLLLKAPQLADGDACELTRSRFAAHGIAAERLLLEGPSSRTDYLAAYSRVDFCLDPFPYPGGTTSVESLWMGVPILTLRGNRFLSHLGESIAHNIGLPEWIAADKGDYIDKAARFAADLPALAELRRGLRERMRASPLLDAARFARGFEQLLWSMWEDKAHLALPPAGSPTLGKAPAKQPPAHEIAQLQQLFRQQRYAELERKGSVVARRFPHAVAGWKALSLAHHSLGKLGDALRSTQKLLEILPDEALSHARLGLIQIKLGHLPEAEASLLHAIALDPQLAEAHVNLGYIRKGQGRVDEAAACYRKALESSPANAAAHTNLGSIELKRGNHREAERHFRAALATSPEDENAMLGLSTVLVKLGQTDEAAATSQRLIERYPNNVEAYSILLFALNYSNTGSSEVPLAVARRYGKLLTRTAGRRYAEWGAPSSPARLRVGLVSGDLYSHPVGYFLEGLLRELDPSRIETIAYVTRPDRTDALSQRLKAHCAAWKSIEDLDDDAAAAMIHADGIHILISLAGHTGDNRLPVFARKPAPVQANWLGYFATTGVAEIDWFVGDPNVCPPGDEAHFTEKIWRLPETYLCFTPPVADVPVAPPPALKNGHITFGCFNHIGKLNDAVVALWSRILTQIPDARLMLKAQQLGDVAMIKQTRARFAAHGVADRLLLEGPSSRTDYFTAYGRIDIALDPFPYPGGTTSVEALWMGVPVLTLRGNRFLSRAGENIMKNLGLPEWIAENESGYLTKAAAFAADLPALATLRSGLRERALASPMFDAPRFARFIEEALWGMWREGRHGSGQ